MTEFEYANLPQEDPENEFYDFNTDADMWRRPCCGADYDCICD